MSTDSPSALPTTGVWTVERGHSSVRFKIVHNSVATFGAELSDFTGAYDAAAGSLSGSARVDGVQTFGALRGKLLEAEFFDAANHPEISFASSSVRTEGDGLVVEGSLTMKGTTKPVRALGAVRGPVPVLNFGTKEVHEHIGIDLQLSIDREEFGILFDKRLPSGLPILGSQVRIEFQLDLAREAEG